MFQGEISHVKCQYLLLKDILYQSHNCPYLEHSNHSSLELGGYLKKIPLQQSTTTLEQ